MARPLLAVAVRVAPDTARLAVCAACTMAGHDRVEIAVVVLDVRCGNKLALRISFMGESSLRFAPLERQQSQTAGDNPAVCISWL